MQRMRLYVALLLTQFIFSTSQADDHAVSLIYHHVSEEAPALTSVSPKVFEQHLDYLAEHKFNIWPLSRIIDALGKGQDLPANTVAITFDDAYRTIYTEAFPRLRKRNWPFTVFVSSEGIDRGYADYLDWEQLREMTKAGNEIGNHSHSHAHLLRRLEGESKTRWEARIRADIKMAAERISSEIGSDSALFAYPYGEYSQSLKAIVRSLGLLRYRTAIRRDRHPLRLPGDPAFSNGNRLRQPRAFCNRCQLTPIAGHRCNGGRF